MDPSGKANEKKVRGSLTLCRVSPTDATTTGYELNSSAHLGLLTSAASSMFSESFCFSVVESANAAAAAAAVEDNHHHHHHHSMYVSSFNHFCNVERESEKEAIHHETDDYVTAHLLITHRQQMLRLCK